ncbi:MAG: cytochrome c maturation protein CcmE [Caldilineaceae bacterium]|nr:cytochrome c maturation protein CcmE [Caldilineaceae bacterium]
MAQEVYRPTIPADLHEKSATKYNHKFLVGGALILLFVGYLGYQIVRATQTTGAYYMTVAELYDQGPQIVGERIRVNGNVVEGSEDWDAENVTLRFSIQDESGEALPIVFFGPRPDNFQRAASAIVEGELKPDGTFEAETLLLKCPSRYEEEPEEEIFIRATH